MSAPDAYSFVGSMAIAIDAFRYTISALRDDRTAEALGDGWPAPSESTDSQTTGTWNDEGVISDQEWELKSAPPPPPKAVELHAEWEFIYLPSHENYTAYSHAYNMIKGSIFRYGKENHPMECDLMWDDAPCNVNLEVCEMSRLFGGDGIATKSMDPARARVFGHVVTDLAQLRHRVAHPARPGQGAASLQYVCQHISYARTMAELLDDHSTVQELDLLLESLFEQGRQVLSFIETHKTCEGLPQSGVDWPRHCERLFDYVIYLKVEEPKRRSRVPPAIVNAALDWSAKYDAPGRKKPDYAARVLVRPPMNVSGYGSELEETESEDEWVCVAKSEEA